jgi:hypothetical protein
MKMQDGDKPSWWLDKEGKLRYDIIRNGTVIQHGVCPEKVPVTIENGEFMWREYKKLTDALIEGDYIGSLRGETNISLNSAHSLQALEKVVEKELGSEKFFELHKKAMEYRNNRWESLPW